MCTASALPCFASARSTRPAQDSVEPSIARRQTRMLSGMAARRRATVTIPVEAWTRSISAAASGLRSPERSASSAAPVRHLAGTSAAAEP